MENIAIRRGETLELTIKADDDTASTVELRAVDKDDAIVIDLVESFVNGVAVIRIANLLLPYGEYEYTLKVEYVDGFTEIYPDVDNCGGECSLPVIKVCKSLEDQVS